MAAHSVRLGKRLRALHAELPLLGLWAAALGCIELFGRRSPSEAGDLVSVLALATLALLTARQHAALPRAWCARLFERGRAFLGRIRRFRISMGIDLRGDPPLERRLPPILIWGVTAALAVMATITSLGRSLPGELRELLLPLSPTLLALYHTLLWSWLGLGALVLFLMPLIFLGEALERSPRWRPRRSRTHGWVGTGYALALVAAASSLPAWVPLALSGALLVALVLLALLPMAPRISILWKPVGAPGLPAAFQWTWLICALGIFYLAVLGSSVVLAVGDRMLGEAGGATPISHFLGLALAWSIPGAYAASFHQAAWMIVRGRAEARLGRIGPRVAVDGAGLERDRARAAAALERAGFEIAATGAPVERTDVRLRLVGEAPEAETRAAEGWPRPVSLGELESSELHERLRRRFEHLCRRALLRGVERALQAAARRRFERGTGFWIAPHCPFVSHLTRDVDESASGWIGEPWHRLIPRPAREYTREVLGALELDLVFVEDGVRIPELKRVLSLLFEHHDLFGPARLEDLRLFAGIPRLRIVVHDYVLEDPYRATGYPETDHEHLGRARILHIYRDRGGNEERERAPTSRDWMPSPYVPSLA